MRIALISPCFYKTQDAAYWLLRSAEHNGYELGKDLFLYGYGRPYRGWMDVQVHELMTWVQALPPEITHFVYVDCNDSLVLQPIEEIEYRYWRIGSAPLLFSVEDDNSLNAGLWMAEREAGLKALGYIRDMKMPEDHRDPDNPQERWRLATLELPTNLDLHRALFDSRTDWTDRAAPHSCIVHLAGGYSDPDSGKAYKVMPLAHRLGIQ